MTPISFFCDQTTQFLTHSFRTSFSSKIKYLAWATVIITVVGILLGLAYVGSLLWKKLCSIEKKNETRQNTDQFFKKTINKTEQKEEDKLKDKNVLLIEHPLNLDPLTENKVETSTVEQAEKIEHQFISIDQRPQIDSNLNFSLNIKNDLYLEEEKQYHFSFDDLITLKVVLQEKGMIVSLDDSSKFEVWYDWDYSTINIQNLNPPNQEIEKKILSFEINSQGKIISLQIGHIKKSDKFELPENFIRCLHVCCKIMFQNSSVYNLNSTSNYIFIKAVKNGIKKVPEFHLQKFAKLMEQGFIKSGKQFKMMVTFLENDLRAIRGADTGGRSRDYLNDLFEGLVHSQDLTFKAVSGSSVVLPYAKKNYGYLDLLPALNQNECLLYQYIGKVFIYCYQSYETNIYLGRNYLIGQHFDDSLFKAALCLTAEEIDTVFEDLTPQTHLKMSQALLNVRKESGMDTNYIEQRFNYLSNFNTLDDSQLLEVATCVHMAGCLSAQFLISEDELNMEEIKQNKDQFKKCLIASILSPTGEHGQFGAHLAPIHAIAQGMKSVCHLGLSSQHTTTQQWNLETSKIDYQVFSTQLQGSLDRKKIASQIVLSSSLTGAKKVEIEKKVNWLQEWIINKEKGANARELKSLLKFLTGSSSLPKLQIIEVCAQKEQPYFPMPVAHTCSFSMDISPIASSYGSYNDHTKENFIKTLREVTLVTILNDFALSNG